MSDSAQMIAIEKNCQRCGTSFQCGTGGREGGCWCMDLPIRLPLPTAGDCYCPSCLEKIQMQQGI